MLRFTREPSLFRNSGLLLLLLQSLLSLVSFKPFHSGVWFQTEPTMLALFIFAALTALWLSTGLSRGWLELSRPPALLLVIVAWVVWQWLATFGASVPMRSWFGPPEIGEGAASYTAMLLCALLALPLWQVNYARYTVLAAASANLLLVCAMHWFFPGKSDEWRPAQWPDYMPFMAAYLWVACCVGGTRIKPWVLCAIILGMYLVLYMGNNETASYLLNFAVAGVIFITGLRMRWWRRFFYPSKRWRYTALGLALLPLLWIPLTLTQPLAWFHGTDTALGSRAVLNRIAVSTMEHEPMRYLAGDGWGRYIDDVFKYSLIDGLHVYYLGKRSPNWPFIDGYSFHTHNQLLENLLSLGIPGMLLWMAIPLVALWTLPRRYFWYGMPLVVALVGLDYMWFSLPQMLAYHAMFWTALVVASSRLKPALAMPASKFLPALLSLLAVVMAWTAVEQSRAIDYGNDVFEHVYSGSYLDYPADWLASDIYRGGDRLRMSAHVYEEWVARQAYRGTLGDNERGWYDYFMRAARKAGMSPNAPARLSLLELEMQNTLLIELSTTALSELNKQALTYMPATIMRQCIRAPYREDMSAPFLQEIDKVTKGDKGLTTDLLAHMLTYAPEHRGALWVAGQMFLKDPDYKEAGQEMVKHSVALGVERVYPLTEEILAPHRR